MRYFIPTGLRSLLQHLFNPLHLYCRLLDRGMRPAKAWTWAERWEVVYRAMGL